MQIFVTTAAKPYFVKKFAFDPLIFLCCHVKEHEMELTEDQAEAERQKNPLAAVAVWRQPEPSR
jgi:hypothetical protein